MTEDVLLTLSLLLVAALAARFLAGLVRIPEILLLVAMGALFGPFALDLIEVPIDSLGAQLMFTLGVSLILFYGGLNLSLPVLRRVWLSLGLLVLPGVVVTALWSGWWRISCSTSPSVPAAARRGAGPDRPGHPDLALHPLAGAPQAGADDRGRVRLQRPDRRRPGARPRRRRALRRRIRRRAGERVRRLGLGSAR